MAAFWLDTLADFLAGFRFEELKPATVEQTSYVILDTMGAIAGGAAEPEMQALTAKLTVSPVGEASVIGTGKTAVSAAAAFLNGTAGTFLEMDEGNRFAKGHPAIHVLPAVWALAEIRKLPGRALMEALVLGYEVGARIGIAAAMRPDMHPHGTWGTVGAAAAVARLLGYDAARIRETINVASSLTLATSKRTMLEGGTVRNAYAGIANRMALMAIDLVEAGFIGERDGLSSVFGHVVSERFDTARMIDGLGRDWQIDRNYFKLHSCCPRRASPPTPSSGSTWRATSTPPSSTTRRRATRWRENSPCPSPWRPGWCAAPPPSRTSPGTRCATPASRRWPGGCS